MNTGTAGKLYTPALLSLATELAQYPLAGRAWRYTAQSRSRTCGSTLSIGLDTGEDGRVCAIGMRVSACAVGQASAAIMARSIIGHDGASLGAAREDLSQWLEADGAFPDWPGIEMLEAARAHTARHGAILLPWNAAAEALSLQPTSS